MTNPKHGEMTGVEVMRYGDDKQAFIRAVREHARQEGWKAGMEEAAKLVEKFFDPGVDDPAYAVVQVDQITQAIRDRINQKD